MDELMSKPLIGVVPLWDEEKDSLWMLPGYMDGIEQAGGLPVMLPLTTDRSSLEQICRTVDGLLFTGGQDVAPSLYREEKTKYCGEICPQRDKMEAVLLSLFVMEMDKPAFGICRGIQFFNALLGGTLYQDLPAQFKGAPKLHHHQKKPYDKPSHKVKIKTGSPLHILLGADEIDVNSCHHQGVKELSKELVCMATAEDGLVEAVFVPGRRFAWAVQWHPEYSLNDEYSQKLFLSFVNACLIEDD
ncbi:MAG: gamma-glutamyl-gamma-aminobutyrate hydrolase family protein [Treponema sp.]|jgi:putative glutamine amidotransferase|nr:gamma-glutamyl-gamma-aminobutyrate hydrolase family protein [Treponema sp.]